MVVKSTLTRVLLLIFGTILIGAVGFKVIGGAEWSFIDSLYMAIITLSTVGFEEVHSLDNAGRVWTIIIILLGISIVAYAVSQITQHLLNFVQYRRRKMSRKISKLKNHYIVCGYGRMGKVICNELRNQKLPFIVIDNNQDKIDQIEEWNYYYVKGDATRDVILEMARITCAKGLVTVLSSDSDNLFVTMSARTMSPDLFIMARCSVLETSDKLKRAGADKVVNPYVAGGHKMAELLITPFVEDTVEITTPDRRYDLLIEEINLDHIEKYIGTAIRDSRIREEYNLLIAGIINPEGDLIFNPSPDTILQQDHTVMLIGEKEDLRRFKESISSISEK